MSILLGKSTTAEETVKLLNVISTSAIGRDYILSKENIIESLCLLMKSQESDNPVRLNCLGILQKLTLRSSVHNKLFKNNLIEWCLNILYNEQATLSEYTVEYCLALLMNLSLTDKGRDQCINSLNLFIKVVLNYLQSDNIQVRTCINGTLYSLFKNKTVREDADIQGVKKALEESILIDSTN